MSSEGGFGEIGDFQVLVEDLAEEDVPRWGVVAVRLLEQPRERCGRLGLVRACLSEDSFFAGYRVFAERVAAGVACALGHARR